MLCVAQLVDVVVCSVPGMLKLTWSRGDFADGVNRVAVALTRPDGSVLEHPACDPNHRAFLRSAAKPAQAVGAVRAGTLERFGLDDRHLALACGSHNGSDLHVALAAEILEAAAVPLDALTPGDDGQGGPLQHQCSGNHALALAWCVANGWPLDTYLDPGHPLQEAINRWVTWWLGFRPEAAPDGCGMVAYRATLADSARAFAHLARAAAGDTEVGADVAHGPDAVRHVGHAGGREALGRCGAAMAAHPELVRWPGQLDTELMLTARGDGLVAKTGAEGFWACGTSDGWGLALKVLDGANRAWPPAGVWAVRQFLADELDAALITPALDAIAQPPVLDGKGATVRGVTIIVERC